MKAHFGCGVAAFVSEPSADDEDDEVEGYASLKAKLDAGLDLWRNHRSFFFSLETLA